MFSQLSNATVRNLILDAVNVSASYNAGALAGVANNSKISNVMISSGSVNSASSAGGLIGWVYNNSVVQNITAKAQVSGSGYSIGGIIGRIQETNSSSQSQLLSSYSTGNVSSNSSIGSAGGLVGGNDGGLIKSSLATGNVNAGGNAGGLVGTNGAYAYYDSSINKNSIISDSYSTGKVTDTSSYSSDKKGMSGGLVGANFGTIKNSYTSGSVASNNSNIYGALVGYNNGTIIASFYNKDTAGISTSDGGIGLSTSAMQDPDIFINAGWASVLHTDNGNWHVESSVVDVNKTEITGQIEQNVYGDLYGDAISFNTSVNSSYQHTYFTTNKLTYQTISSSQAQHGGTVFTKIDYQTYLQNIYREKYTAYTDWSTTRITAQYGGKVTSTRTTNMRTEYLLDNVAESQRTGTSYRQYSQSSALRDARNKVNNWISTANLSNAMREVFGYSYSSSSEYTAMLNTAIKQNSQGKYYVDYEQLYNTLYTKLQNTDKAYKLYSGYIYREEYTAYSDWSTSQTLQHGGALETTTTTQTTTVTTYVEAYYKNEYQEFVDTMTAAGWAVVPGSVKLMTTTNQSYGNIIFEEYKGLISQSVYQEYGTIEEALENIKLALTSFAETLYANGKLTEAAKNEFIAALNDTAYNSLGSKINSSISPSYGNSVVKYKISESALFNDITSWVRYGSSDRNLYESQSNTPEQTYYVTNVVLVRQETLNALNNRPHGGNIYYTRINDSNALASLKNATLPNSNSSWIYQINANSNGSLNTNSINYTNIYNNLIALWNGQYGINDRFTLGSISSTGSVQVSSLFISEVADKYKNIINNAMVYDETTNKYVLDKNKLFESYKNLYSKVADTNPLDGEYVSLEVYTGKIGTKWVDTTISSNTMIAAGESITISTGGKTATITSTGQSFENFLSSMQENIITAGLKDVELIYKNGVFTIKGNDDISVSATGGLSSILGYTTKTYNGATITNGKNTEIVIIQSGSSSSSYATTGVLRLQYKDASGRIHTVNSGKPNLTMEEALADIQSQVGSWFQYKTNDDGSITISSSSSYSIYSLYNNNGFRNYHIEVRNYSEEKASTVDANETQTITYWMNDYNAQNAIRQQLLSKGDFIINVDGTQIDVKDEIISILIPPLLVHRQIK